MLDGLLVKLDSNGTLKYFGAANWWADSVFFDLRTGELGWILYQMLILDAHLQNKGLKLSGKDMQW